MNEAPGSRDIEGRVASRGIGGLGRGTAALPAALLAAVLFACGGGDSPSGPSSGSDGQDTGTPYAGSGGDEPADDTGGEPRTVTIEMYRIAYVAPTASNLVTIKLGESVRWVNRDGTRHTATSDSVPPGGKGFSTGWLDPGGEYVFRPNVTGTWVYSCLQYPDRMSGARLRVVP